jgi:uncharacterized protein YfaS (alpha-2-macroglobulin family)
LFKLYEKVDSEGAVKWWGDNVSVELSLYALYGFKLAEDIGISTQANITTKVIEYVKSASLDNSQAAFREYILSTFSQSNHNKVIELNNQELGNDALAYLTLTAHNNGQTSIFNNLVERLKNNVIEDTRGFYWQSDRNDFYNSRNEAITAVAIRAMLLSENYDLADGAMIWLNKAKTGYYWYSTFTTVQVIQTMYTYSNYASDAPEFDYNVTFNNQMVTEGTVEPTNTNNEIKSITIKNLEVGTNNLIVEKTGKGRLFINAVLTKFVPNKPVQSSDQINIKTSLTDLEGNTKNYFNVGEVGFLQIELSTTTNLHYIQMKNITPSGFEPVNMHLSNVPYEMEELPWYKRIPWDSHISGQEYSAFLYRLNNDKVVYNFPIRARTAGEFIINPSKVELMYSPQIWTVSDYGTIKIYD